MLEESLHDTDLDAESNFAEDRLDLRAAEGVTQIASISLLHFSDCLPVAVDVICYDYQTRPANFRNISHARVDSASGDSTHGSLGLSGSLDLLSVTDLIK